VAYFLYNPKLEALVEQDREIVKALEARFFPDAMWPHAGMPFWHPEPTLIDIATTKIIDSRDPGGDGDSITTFSTFFAEISSGRLKMATDATVVDADDREVQGTFDFKYDTETEKFGAGTAFLQEGDEKSAHVPSAPFAAP